ncbi:hypothetical protein [Novosphingobium rosa]|uniref:hypothetical protein n=1 Tax=Novosphingobium rosa TaxID=76978 RepID=UPI0008373120|nr:hypothetical protein [Novosphingobium rosa]
MSGALILLALLAAPPADTDTDWTPHSAAALLDASFGSAAECQQQLDEARARVSHAPPVHGLGYDRLFAQGRCETERLAATAGAPVWRIHMHWPKVKRVPSPHALHPVAGIARKP